jgi:hypothetical protein
MADLANKDRSPSLSLSLLLLSTRLVGPDAPQAWTLARTVHAQENFQLPVKPAGANRLLTKSALWLRGVRLASQFPRPGKRKHGGRHKWRRSTTGHREPEKRRWQGICPSYIVRGYMLEVVGPNSLPHSLATKTSDVESNHLDPRSFFAALLQNRAAPPRYGTQLGHCRKCSSAAWGNAEFCTSRVHWIPYCDYTGSMFCAVYVCPRSATVHKVLYYPYAWC